MVYNSGNVFLITGLVIHTPLFYIISFCKLGLPAPPGHYHAKGWLKVVSCTNDENIESLIPPNPEETIYQADEEKAVAAFYDFLNNLNKNIQTKSSQDIVVSKIRKTSAQTYKDSNFRQTKAGKEAPIYNYAPLLRDGRYVYFDRGKKCIQK